MFNKKEELKETPFVWLSGILAILLILSWVLIWFFPFRFHNTMMGFNHHTMNHENCHQQLEGKVSLKNHDMADRLLAFETEKQEIINQKLHEGNYACCLTNPCNTCVSLDPYHGEGASCTCLEDLVNGKAPCGECIGGILSGRGNKYLKEYFVPSIVDKVGEEHQQTIEAIIVEKYSA